MDVYLIIGLQDYNDLLTEAIKSYDDAWLANQLRENGRLNRTEEKRKPSGGTTTAKVPVTAPDTLAEGEFSRFYARGLCLRAIADGIGKVVVYRAKEVKHPRTKSQEMIGKEIDAEALLNDLRINTGVDTALRLPPGPNSGLSVQLP